MADRYIFQATPADEGERLDKFIASRAPQLSRSGAQRLIEEGMALISGKRVKAGHKMRSGEAVELKVPEPRPPRVEPEPIPLSILYEDDHLLVVDKPAGMVVHPGPGNYSGTLVNALLHHCRGLSSVGGVQRPGIVHRLDKGTSGLLIVAKDDSSHLRLSEDLKNRRVKRCYEALVAGSIKEDKGFIEAAVGRHKVERKKMAVDAERGRWAFTEYMVLRRFTACTHLELSLKTGRTHQIRVHMAHIGHPLIGDTTYGHRRALTSAIDDFLKDFYRRHRPALHAKSIEFYHPVTGDLMSFSSPPPPDMARAIELLALN